MVAKEIIRRHLLIADRMATECLNAMDDAQIMQRPHAKSQTVNWQVGHLVLSEHQQISVLNLETMPDLPDGFASTYEKPKVAKFRPEDLRALDERCQKFSRESLIGIYRCQRETTLRVLQKCSDAELGRASGIRYTPVFADVFLAQALHWLLHLGQWQVVKAALGAAQKPWCSNAGYLPE